jgi:CheY-like chemotaxis protein
MVKVLLADDETIFTLPVGDFLEDEGFEVVRVASAVEVLDRAAAADVLVIDARLPSSKYEGVDSVGKLLRSNRIRKDVPIIFISVDPDTDEGPAAALQQCKIPAGRYRWLTKPFEHTRLATTINSELTRLRGNHGH